MFAHYSPTPVVIMDQIKPKVRRFLHIAEYIGLFIIAIATVVAMGEEVWKMITAMKVTLADLLLMFIYLEVFAMIAIYMDSGKLPVRMPLYIALVALARYLILDMKSMDEWMIVGITVACLVLAVTILIIRFGHVKYPYKEHERP